MKALKVILAILMVLCLCACKDTDKKPDTVIYDVIGVTFKNSTTKANGFRGSLTLYKEGDFELYEVIEDKPVLVRGDYKQRDNEYDLYPQNCSFLPEKIVFRAVKDEEIDLETDLNVSKMGDVYFPESSIVEETENPRIFYNINKGENDLEPSALELYDDGTFRLIEVQGFGAVVIEGLYGKEGNVYMFSNFDKINNMYGEPMYNFEFFIQSEDTLELNEDLIASHSGSIFTKDPNLLASGDNVPEVMMAFAHEAISDVKEEYLPKISVSADGHFVFTENVYAGMATIEGEMEAIEKAFVFHVSNNGLMGFAGDDVTEFSIYHDDATGDYRIDKDICMTRTGDVFYVYYYGE